jgi:signal transduction histidine kinase
MSPELYLILHNVLSIISTIVALAMALFLFMNGQKKISGRALSLTMLSIAIFSLSHVIGVNTQDPKVATILFMFNLSMFTIASTNVHAILALVEEDIKKRWMIIFFYITSFVFIIVFLISPNLFLLSSVPKMYFTNYYVPGQFNWMRLAFLFGITLPYLIYILIKAYYDSISEVDRRHYIYALFVIIIGYFIGFIPNFLVYDIAIDPIWGMSFAALLSIPLIYAAIRYELFNVRVVAKQAFSYSIGITIIGGIIILFNYLDSWIISLIPFYSSKATIIISSLLTVIVGILVWKNLRKGDLLRYEFITTITHKFRTPLTGIKWATENLTAMDLPDAAFEQIEYIKNSNSKLVELTDLLMNTSSSEKNLFNYVPVKNNISGEVEHVIQSLARQIQIRKTGLIKEMEPDIFVMCDVARIRFVIQSFIENAIHYTKEGGTIIIKIKKVKNEAVFSVKDTGIGIDKAELPMIFEKFYRTNEARTTDTEGMGIGLFISKEIVKHHKGKMWVESDGIGKGSTFYFSIPTIK